MGRVPCCSKVGLYRGPWTPSEDAVLISYIKEHDEGQWRSLPKKAGLLRCGKSCRLRWMNYLRPGIKRGGIGQDEEELILKLHALLGNRWSLIAGRLPGRTDNEIKNYWNTHLSKKLKRNGIDPITHKPIIGSFSQCSSNNGFCLPRNQQFMQRRAAQNTSSNKGKDGGKDHATGVTGFRLHMPKATKVIPKVPPPWMSRQTKVLPVYEERNNGSTNGGEFMGSGGSNELCRSGFAVSLLDQNVGWIGNGEFTGEVHGYDHGEGSTSEIFQLWHDSGQNIVRDDHHSIQMKIHEPSLVCLEDEKMLVESFIQSLMD